MKVPMVRMVTLVVLVAGCAGEAPAVSRSSAAGSTPAPVVAKAGCDGTQVLMGAGFPEVRGTARDAELWGLLFIGAPPIKRGEQTKIVWRMTGEGPLRIEATLPDGTAARRLWGPEEHEGSTWRRPGDEWGTGFVSRRPAAGRSSSPARAARATSGFPSVSGHEGHARLPDR
ncbi:hypothetical protein ABGB18_23230 [Nonomuraea sp. B12E4]|uniref:hypothetical protein n=1 Tax=Nonomuraea sp. B12E4 TaxID=3153564 RepID=UPI00325D6307